MTDLKNGRLPVGPKRNRQYMGGVSDWRTWRLRDAMVVGIETEIDDRIVGRIPARVPLPLETAARAVNLGIRKARQLVQEPEFKADLKSAIEDYRKTLEPGSIAMALSIRDDTNCTPKERIKAAEFLYGPKAATGVTVNVQQNNLTTQSDGVGYIVNLSKDRLPRIGEGPKVVGNRIIEATQDKGEKGLGRYSVVGRIGDDDEVDALISDRPSAKIIDITPPDKYSGAPSDVEREQAEAAQVRPSRG